MIFKNSLVIGSFTILSVLLGVFRDRLLAHFVGVGPDLDVYNAVFRVPDLTLGILFAFISSATVVPFVKAAISRNDKQDIDERMSSLFVFFGGTMALISIIVVLILPFIAPILVPGFSDIQQKQFILYTRILTVQPILLGLSTLLSTLLQAKNRFFVYGSAPILYTTSIILSIFFYRSLGLSALIAGVVLGSVLHFGLQTYQVLREGLVIKNSLFRKELIKEQLKISIPRSGSVIITQLRTLFFASFATSLGTGVLSVYVFALRIKEAGMLILPQTLAIASIPTLSEKSATDEALYNSIIKKYSVRVFILSALGAAAVSVFARLVIFILFGDTGYNDLIEKYLNIFMVAFPFASFAVYISNALSAGKDTKTYFIANCITTPISVAFAFFAKSNGLAELSLAYSVALASILLAVSIVVLLFIKKNIYEY